MFFCLTERNGATEQRTVNHAPAGESQPVGGNWSCPLETLHHSPLTNPSHRRTNRIQPVASASLTVDSAFQDHSLASHGYNLPCTDDESFLEVINVFENMKDVLDWPVGAERGGVEGGVGLTDIRVGE